MKPLHEGVDMNEAIIQLCAYAERGTTPSELKFLEDQLGGPRTLSSAIKLLVWLTSPFDRPLELGNDPAAFATIGLILGSLKELSALFEEVGPGRITFRHNVSLKKKQTIKDFVLSKQVGILAT